MKFYQQNLNGWYHSMAIAKSKTVCDIDIYYTLDICSKYIGPQFRLKAHRGFYNKWCQNALAF